MPWLSYEGFFQGMIACMICACSCVQVCVASRSEQCQFALADNGVTPAGECLFSPHLLFDFHTELPFFLHAVHILSETCRAQLYSCLAQVPLSI